MSMSELHYAIIGGNEEIVKLLLSAGSDGDIILRSGHSALDFATLIGKEGIASVLQESKEAGTKSVFQPNVAVITCKHKKKRNPLHFYLFFFFL